MPVLIRQLPVPFIMVARHLPRFQGPRIDTGPPREVPLTVGKGTEGHVREQAQGRSCPEILARIGIGDWRDRGSVCRQGGRAPVRDTAIVAIALATLFWAMLAMRPPRIGRIIDTIPLAPAVFLGIAAYGKQPQPGNLMNRGQRSRTASHLGRDFHPSGPRPVWRTPRLLLTHSMLCSRQKMAARIPLRGVRERTRPMTIRQNSMTPQPDAVQCPDRGRDLALQRPTVLRICRCARLTPRETNATFAVEAQVPAGRWRT